MPRGRLQRDVAPLRAQNIESRVDLQKQYRRVPTAAPDRKLREKINFRAYYLHWISCQACFMLIRWTATILRRLGATRTGDPCIWKCHPIILRQLSPCATREAIIVALTLAAFRILAISVVG